MEIRTHQKINTALCGTPMRLDADTAVIELPLTDEMTVDDTGLTHGSFVFGLADHAAMLAVNHPNVVLGAAECRFLKPAVSGRTAVAEGRVTEKNGKKRLVAAEVKIDGDVVFTANFTCFIPETHVLSGMKA